MSSNEEFDLIVIGTGPAGEKGAAQAAYFGKKVALIEKEPNPGGAAVHTGTLPSKTLRETALYLSGYRSRTLYGISVELTDRYAAVPHLIRRKDAIADAESKRIMDNVNRHHITYIRGHGEFAGPHSVHVRGTEENRTIHGKHILIATGSKPFHPDEFDFSHPAILDSDQVLHIDRLPNTLVILGAGVIGCEYACMFAALGVQVTLVDSRERILPFLDGEVVDRLQQAMVNLGIRLIHATRWTGATCQDQVQCQLSDGQVIRAENLLYAAGRTGNTSSLKLEKIGLTANARQLIEVDENYQTKVPHVYAAGDIIGFPALASTSMEQGRLAVCHAFGFSYKRTLSHLLPFGIYTIPEVSSIGETEETATAKGLDFVVGRALYRENARGQITGDTEGITKLLVDKASRKILGCHVIGERASELVHLGIAVMQLGGTVDTFIDMVFNYPTLSESFKYAAYDALGSLQTQDKD